jgi:hypothetical protein
MKKNTTDEIIEKVKAQSEDEQVLILALLKGMEIQKAASEKPDKGERQ